MSKKREKY